LSNLKKENDVIDKANNRVDHEIRDEKKKQFVETHAAPKINQVFLASSQLAAYFKVQKNDMPSTNMKDSKIMTGRGMKDSKIMSSGALHNQDSMTTSQIFTNPMLSSNPMIKSNPMLKSNHMVKSSPMLKSQIVSQMEFVKRKNEKMQEQKFDDLHDKKKKKKKNKKSI